MQAASSVQLSVTGAAFGHGEFIPARHTCDGEDVSPELSWRGVPEGTESFALIMDDPDAPGGVFTHWVYYNIPGLLRALPEDVEKTEQPAAGGTQASNDFGNVGYNGPCPPPGPAHHYHLIIYAIDMILKPPPGSTKREVRAAMRGHVLGQGELVGLYQRR